MFGDYKKPDEEGYDKEKDTLKEDAMSDENMTLVVETIFRKAQNEKQYCTFYGELCEQIIKLELTLKGFKTTVK